MAKRIDFKHVRAAADISQVLTAYGIDLQKDGTKPGQMKGLCPFHEDTKPSLKVNVERGIYKCFVCGAGGNTIDFVKEMEDCEVREAAAKVADICGIAPTPDGTTPQAQKKPARKTKTGSPSPATPETPKAEPALATHNPALSFELKLDFTDPEMIAWLESRGIGEEMRHHFGLGKASKRSKTIADRLAIPLRNQQKELIGYCGRHIGDELPDDDTPKYILPKGFRKELELYGIEHVAPNPKCLVLFESYFSVIRHQAEIPCVSPFGRSISPEQVALIGPLQPKRIFVVFDGDEPGRSGAVQVAGALAPLAWTRIVELPDGVKPHRLDWAALRALLEPNW